MEFLVRAHAALSHFPIALLVISFGATLLGRFRPRLRIDTFLAMAGGLGVGLFSVATGIVVHEPYEHLPIISEIQVHQFAALGGTFALVVLAVFRFLSRRKGEDLEGRAWYPLAAAVGLVWILFVGATGGDLVYEHGINVSGVNPLQVDNGH
ncbi:MAG: DUF2231 domain-containing protein [Myxococcota bacterium]